jgi:hypothetical protein
MKNLLFPALTCFFIVHIFCSFIYASQYVIVDDNTIKYAREETKKHQEDEKKRLFLIEKATLDIGENMSILVDLYKQLGEYKIEFYIAIADKLYSQPLSVIKFVKESKMQIEEICPRFFGEDSRSCRQ